MNIPNEIQKIIDERRDDDCCPCCGTTRWDGFTQDEEETDCGYTVKVDFCMECEWQEGEDILKYFRLG